MIRARPDAVASTRLGTTLANAAGISVATVEHLMAALWAAGIDNALIEIDGPETPIMDGSAQPFLDAIDRAGRRPQQAARQYLQVLEPVEVAEGGAYARLLPAETFEMAFSIDFAAPAIGVQSLDLCLDEAVFRTELADCRTFGLLEEVEALRAAGLGRGGSLDNVVVVSGGDVLNPEGLRRPDEFVRHKIVDAIGDLYLLGAPLLGRFESHCGGHALNNALLRALLARSRSWRLVAAPRALRRAV